MILRTSSLLLRMDVKEDSREIITKCVLLVDMTVTVFVLCLILFPVVV